MNLKHLRAAGLIKAHIENVKIVLSGTIERPVTVRSLGITKGARAAIESAGGTIEE